MARLCFDWGLQFVDPHHQHWPRQATSISVRAFYRYDYTEVSTSLHCSYKEIYGGYFFRCLTLLSPFLVKAQHALYVNKWTLGTHIHSQVVLPLTQFDSCKCFTLVRLNGYEGLVIQRWLGLAPGSSATLHCIPADPVTSYAMLCYAKEAPACL